MYCLAGVLAGVLPGVLHGVLHGVLPGWCTAWLRTWGVDDVDAVAVVCEVVCTLGLGTSDD